MPDGMSISIEKQITGPDGKIWEFVLKPESRMIFYRRSLGDTWSPELCVGGIHHVLPYFDGSFGEELAPLEEFSVETNGEGVDISMWSPAAFWDPPPPHLQAPESFVRPHGEIKLAPGECENYPKKHTVRQKQPALVVSDRLEAAFIDGLEVESVAGLIWFARAPEKHPANPVVKADKPWESLAINCVGATTLFADGRYRMWYNAGEKSGQSFQPEDKKTAENWQKSWNVCYAESDDGVNWRKPALGLVEYMGGKKNNIVPSLWRCPVIVEDGHEHDPEKKYKCFNRLELDTFVPELCKFHCSPDGIHWRTFPGRVDFSQGVRPFFFTWNSVFFDDAESDPAKQWKAYGYFGTAPARRTCGMAWSADGVNWTASPLNPVISPRQFGNTKYIHDFVVWRESGHYLGILQQGDQKADYDFVLMSSRDGVHFSRVGSDKFIARGNPGEWDSGSITNGCCMPLLKDGKISFYYAAANDTKQLSGIGLAFCDSGCYAGFKAKGKDGFGTLVSRPVTLQAGNLKLSLKLRFIGDGAIRCGLKKTETDNYLPGYSPEESITSGKDNARHSVSWRENTCLPVGTFRIELQLSSGVEAYGFAITQVDKVQQY